MSKFYFSSLLQNINLKDRNNNNCDVDKKDNKSEEIIKDIVEENLNNNNSENDNDIIIPHIDHPVVESKEPIKIKSLPDLNEAQERNKKGEPSASIITTACGVDGSNDECFYKNDCPILNAYDKMIYERLEEDEVIAIEVRWCHKYRPKYKYR